jgi:hypothetical protein
LPLLGLAMTASIEPPTLVLSTAPKGTKRKQPAQPPTSVEEPASKRARSKPSAGTNLLIGAAAAKGSNAVSVPVLTMSSHGETGRENNANNDDDEDDGDDDEGDEEEGEEEGEEGGAGLLTAGTGKAAGKNRPRFRRRRFNWTQQEDHHILLVAAACLDFPLVCVPMCDKSQ